MTFYLDVCCFCNFMFHIWRVCVMSTWHHETFLVQLYWHLAVVLYFIVNSVITLEEKEESECLRQIVPKRWASIRKCSFTKYFCVCPRGDKGSGVGCGIADCNCLAGV